MFSLCPLVVCPLDPSKAQLWDLCTLCNDPPSHLHHRGFDCLCHLTSRPSWIWFLPSGLPSVRENLNLIIGWGSPMLWEMGFSLPLAQKSKIQKVRKSKMQTLFDFLMAVSYRYKTQKTNISGLGFFAVLQANTSFRNPVQTPKSRFSNSGRVLFSD